MEIKITCGCGQKYVFEFDPENGQVPAAVNCPACGADGTREANDILTQVFSQSPAGSEPERVAPAPAVVEGGPVRINPPVRLTMAASPPPPLPAAIPAAAVPVPPPIRPLAVAAPEAEATEEFNLGRGILGAALGAGLGAGVMYGFFELAGIRFPFMGVGIGALAGYGARLLGRGTDNTMAIIAAVFALAANAGTLYLMFGDFVYFYFVSLAISAWLAYRIASH
jgi:hypothetical protein